jgi:hypothetical protein
MLRATSDVGFQSTGRPNRTELLPRLIPLCRLRPTRPTRAQGHGVDMRWGFCGGDTDILLLHREWDEHHGGGYLLISRVSSP